MSGPYLLAIETSCDDTAAAVLDAEGHVLSSVSHSQDLIHEKYGGVVPEVASRAHVERATAVVREAVAGAGLQMGDLGRVAVTVGPGLIGALLVGLMTAKAIAWSRRLPLTPVHHLHGHLAAVWLTEPGVGFPHVTLIASGGHTSLVRVDGPGTFRVLGQTMDDAAGEAMDKGARLLGLGYPGGRELDRLAEDGDPGAFSFPVALRKPGNLDFSFSGLKTALYYVLRDMTPDERRAAARPTWPPPTGRRRSRRSYRSCSPPPARKGWARWPSPAAWPPTRCCVGASRPREPEAGYRVVVPPVRYCTDNAAMIGAAALAGPQLPFPDYLGLEASASLALGQLPAW